MTPTTRADLLSSITGKAPSKPSSKDDLLNSLKSPDRSADFSERMAKLSESIPQTPAIKVPEGGWQSNEPESKGFAAKMFQALSIPLGFAASTGMEIADLVSGQDASFSDWWRQAYSDPINWGDVRAKHKNIYKYMAPFTFGLSAVPAAFDMLGLETIADFSADVIFDPLNILGGIGKLASLKGATSVAADLLKVAGVADRAGDVARAKLAKDAAIAMSDGKSLSAGVRFLRTQGTAGKQLIEEMGLNPGLRARLPGTGVFGRFSRADQIPGIRNIVATRRAKQVPVYYKAQAGLSDSAEDIGKLSAAIIANRGNKFPSNPVDLLGKAAGKQPVELMLPKGLRSIGASLQIMDSPIRGWNKVMGTRGGQILRDVGPGIIFNSAKFADGFLNHPDPAVRIVAKDIHRRTRGANWRGRKFNADIETNVIDAVNLGRRNNLTPDDLYELGSFDSFDDLLFEGALRPGVLPESFYGVPLEQLEIIHQAAVRTSRESLAAQMGHRGGDFEVAVKTVAATEGGYVPRHLTPEGRAMMVDGADEVPVESWKDLGAASQSNLAQRRNAANLKDRKIVPGGVVEVKVPEGWVAPPGTNPKSLRWSATGKKVEEIQILDEVIDPRVAGKSVARQVNEAAEAMGLPKIYDTDYAGVWAAYGNVVGSDFRMRLIEEIFESFGILVDDMAPLIDEAAKLYKKGEEAAGRLAKAKADLKKAHNRAAEAARIRMGHYRKAANGRTMGNVRPDNVGGEEILDNAVQLEEAFIKQNDAFAEVEVITARVEVVQARMDELARTRTDNGSMAGREYVELVEEYSDLAARLHQLDQASAQIDAYVNIVRKMRDLEAVRLPENQPIEGRKYAEKYWTDEPLDTAMYTALREEMEDQMAFLADAIESIEKQAVAYGNKSPESILLEDLKMASHGALQTMKGRASVQNTYRSASKRIEWFNKEIRKFIDADQAVGGHEYRLSSATRTVPLETRRAQILESIARQNNYIDELYQAVRVGDPLPLEGLPGLGSAARTVPAADGTLNQNFLDDFVGPEVLISEEEGLARVNSYLLNQRNIAVEHYAKANDRVVELSEALQSRIAKKDEALRQGDAKTADREKAMGQVAAAEAMAQAADLETLQPILKEFDQIIRTLNSRLGRAAGLRDDAGLGVADGLNDAMAQLDELLKQYKNQNMASPLRTSGKPLKDLQNIMQEDMGHWGPWTILADSNQMSRTDIVSLLDGYQRAGDTIRLGAFGKQYNKVYNYIKSAQLTSLGWVSRNVQGAMMSMFVEGVPPTMVMRTHRLLGQALRAGEGRVSEGVDIMIARNPGNAEWKAIRQLIDVGVLKSGQGASALDSNVMGTFSRTSVVLKNVATKGRVKRIELSPLKADNIVSSTIQDVNNRMEDAIRIGSGLHALSTGGSVDDALELIARSQFDYGELTKYERAIKQIVPFYTWTRKNMPYQASQLWRNPGKYNALYSAKRNIERNSDSEFFVPAYYMAPFGIRLPFAMGGNQTYFTPDLPFTDLFRLQSEESNLFKVAGEFGMTQVTPIVKAPLELMTGKQFFKGLPISDRWGKTPLYVDKVPGLSHGLRALGLMKNGKMRQSNVYMLEQFMPFYGRARRLLPTEDKFEGERHLQSALSFFFGIPLRINTPQTARSARLDMDRKRAATQRDGKDLANTSR